MKFKSTAAIVLALIMTLSVFLPGCGKSDEKNTPDTTSEQTSAGDTTQEPAEGKKEIEMSIAMWDIVEFGNDEIGKKIQDDLKIKVNLVPLSWDNDLEQIKLFGASGNLPDFFASYTVEYDMNRFYSWINQGLTRTIPEELIDKYSNVKMLFDNSPEVKAVKNITGNYCYIPRPESLKRYYEATQQVMYYRKDWMANVGIAKEPETVDEFYNMLKAFSVNDPNKNGKADTFGITSAGLNLATFAMWGEDPAAWIEEDGKIVPAYLSDKMIEPLKYFRKLYQENIFDPEFSQNGYKQAIQKFTTNTFGVLVRNGDVHWLQRTIIDSFSVANPEISDPLTAVGILAPMKKDASSKSGWPMSTNTCGTEVSAKVDNEKLDRYFELLDYLLKPEIRNILRYGFEGVDYTINNGVFVPAIDPNTNEPVNIAEKYPSSLIWELTDWDFDNPIENPYEVNIPQGIKDLGKAARDKYNAVALQQNIAWSYIFTPSKETTIIEPKDTFTNIIMSTDDVEAMFEAFKKDCKEKGIDKVIEEVTAEAKKLGLY